MRLGILMTNTDESAFAHRHPLDGQKFTTMIQSVRPAWLTEVFAIKDGVFPDDTRDFDGVIITGSPASTRSDAPWVAKSLALIRQMHAAQVPMFGACFGHQAIALALGGQIGDNPGGWFHGVSVNKIVKRAGWMRDLPDPFRLYASQKEQVVALPEGAEVLSRSDGCPISGFAIGNHIFTTQHHPEMTERFFAALSEDLRGELGAKRTAEAFASLGEPADSAVFAKAMARFFEQAIDRSGCSQKA